MSAISAIDTLRDERYFSLETFKKDGSGVKTPVWFAEELGGFGVFTDGTSYKVKRLRRNPRVRVAACDIRGNVHGTWIEGIGRLVEDVSEQERVHDALIKKYGWQMRVGDLFSTLSRRIKRRAYIVISIPSGMGAPKPLLAT